MKYKQWFNAYLVIPVRRLRDVALDRETPIVPEKICRISPEEKEEMYQAFKARLIDELTVAAVYYSGNFGNQPTPIKEYKIIARKEDNT